MRKTYADRIKAALAAALLGALPLFGGCCDWFQEIFDIWLD